MFRFYEISPAVIDYAQSDWFTFLASSRVKIEIALGDARTTLEREPPQGFDVLVLDAFPSDSVPVHLLTREAVALYLTHLTHRAACSRFISPIVCSSWGPSLRAWAGSWASFRW